MVTLVGLEEIVFGKSNGTEKVRMLVAWIATEQLTNMTLEPISFQF